MCVAIVCGVTSSARARASSTSSASSASRLFTDGLRLVSLYLGAEEWGRTKVWRTCRQWYSASKSMVGLEFSLLHRRLNSCVDVLDMHDPQFSRFAELDADPRPDLAPANVDEITDSPLGRHFTYVQWKVFSLDESCEPLARCSWLHTVRLDLRSMSRGYPASRSTRLIMTLARLPHLHTLWTTDDRFPHDDLRALSQLSSLRSFRRFRYFEYGSPAWTIDDLSAFCEPTHRLHQLTDIGLSSKWWTDLTGAELHHLSRLPALRLGPILDEKGLTVDCLPYLQRFIDAMPAVNSGAFRLHLRCRSSISIHLTPAVVVDYADIFSRIESLRLDDLRVSSKGDLAQCMAVMTRLTDLTLRDLRSESGGRVDTLAGLGAAPSLTSLTLNHCHYMDFSAMCHLAACTRLIRLHVLDKLLLSFEIAALTPPSSSCLSSSSSSTSRRTVGTTINRTTPTSTLVA